MSLINNSTLLPFQALTTMWHLQNERGFEFQKDTLTEVWVPHDPLLAPHPEREPTL